MKEIARLFAPKLATVVLVLVLICVMAGCSSESAESAITTEPAVTTELSEAPEPTNELSDITMSDIVSANSRDALLAKYDSVYTQIQSEYVNLINLYISKDICFEENFGYAYIFDNDDNWCYMEISGQNYLAYYWYAMSDDEKASRILTPESCADPVVEEESTLSENIEEISDNGDGTITLVTQISAEDMCKRLEQDSVEYPEEFYTSPQRITYVLDKESLEIISFEQTVLAESGEIFFNSETVTYNTSQPELMQTMLSLIDEFKDGDKENPRTIKIIYDYGTDQEEDYEITIDPKFKVLPFTREGYDYIFNDPEKTEVYTGGDGVSDVTMYAFNNDQAN